jgi:hypothetical protein
MQRLIWILSILALSSTLALLPACRGDDDDDDTVGDDDDDDDTATDDDDEYRHELTVTAPVVGDFSCLGEDLGEVVAGESASITGYVEDFSDDVAVAGAKLLVWASNAPADGEGNADFSFDTGTDQTGIVEVDAGTVQACSPFAYKVWTEWEPQETMPTYEVGNVLPPVGDPEWDNFGLISVSYATYQIIPLSLAIQPDPAKGMAAGTFYDCNRDPVENAQLLVVDGSGNKAENVYIRYFVDELPDRDQEATSVDGLFGAIDVPPGAWKMQLWGMLDAGMPACPNATDGDGRCLLAESNVYVIAGSINIATADMIPFPDDCYSAPE